MKFEKNCGIIYIDESIVSNSDHVYIFTKPARIMISSISGNFKMYTTRKIAKAACLDNTNLQMCQFRLLEPNKWKPISISDKTMVRILFIDMCSTSGNHMIVIESSDSEGNTNTLYTGNFTNFEALKSNEHFQKIRIDINEIFLDSVIERRGYETVLNSICVRMNQLLPSKKYPNKKKWRFSMYLPTFGHENLLVDISKRFPDCVFHVSAAREFLLATNIDPSKLIVAEPLDIIPNENATISIHNQNKISDKDFHSLHKNGIQFFRIEEHFENDDKTPSGFLMNIKFGEHPTLSIIKDFIEFFESTDVIYTEIDTGIPFSEQFYMMLSDWNGRTMVNSSDAEIETEGQTQEFQPTLTSTQLPDENLESVRHDNSEIVVEHSPINVSDLNLEEPSNAEIGIEHMMEGESREEYIKRIVDHYDRIISAEILQLPLSEGMRKRFTDHLNELNK